MNKFFKIVCILLFLLLGNISNGNAGLNIFPQPRYIPKLSFYGDSGKSYTVDNFKSDLLMVMIWSRYCGPCIGDMKHMDSFAQKMKDKGVRVIIISPASEWKSIDERRTFLKRIGAPNLVSYLDKKANFMLGMGVMSTPTVILINNRSEEVGQISGSVEWDEPEVIDYILKLKKSLY